jgi:hypothetical protein
LSSPPKAPPPPPPLPLATISAELSAWVPRNKWAGLQQAGVSHLWHTHSGPGCLPVAR